ncbi:dynein light chain family protein [bacterium]|nr:dynein light chain family protein [bacterium]
MEESKSSGVVEVIKRSMNDEAFEEAIKLTKKAFESYEVDKDVAERIKSDMEKKFDGSWYVSPQHNFVSFFFRISTHTHTHIHTHTQPITCIPGIVSWVKISVALWSLIRSR